jgi:hypothetical protein
MCTALVLVVPNFTNTFVLECGALGRGLGALFKQEGCPLAFTNNHSCDHNLGNSTYEKDMMVILHIVET